MWTTRIYGKTSVTAMIYHNTLSHANSRKQETSARKMALWNESLCIQFHRPLRIRMIQLGSSSSSQVPLEHGRPCESWTVGSLGVGLCEPDTSQRARLRSIL